MIEEIELTEKLFAEHPVWRWNDSRDALTPVARHVPLPEGDDLWVRSRFVAPNEDELSGYIVANVYGVEGFSLFVHGKDCMFGEYIQHDLAANLAFIRKAFANPDWELFPLNYSTDFHFEGKPNLSGVFEPW